MNLKKELEKMNHADLLWICKYMKISCNSEYTNKKIIGILLEPISNKKYRARGLSRVVNQNDEQFNMQQEPVTESQPQNKLTKKQEKDFLSRLEALSLTQEEPEKTTQKPPEKPPEKPQEKSSNCTIC